MKRPVSAPVRDISLARAERRLKQGPGVAWSPRASQGGRLGSALSRTWLTSQSRFGSTIERWIEALAAAVSRSHPFEAAAAVLVADQLEVGAARRRGRAGGAQIGIFARGAVAVAAADLDRVGDLAVDEAVAVRVLAEMAVGALQAALGMDVHHVDGAAGIDAGGHEQALAGAAEGVGIAGRDDVAVGVEQIALAVAAEDAAEVPAMAVIVGELGLAGERVHPVVDLAQEVDVAPQAARRGGLGVAVEHLVDLGRGRIGWWRKRASSSGVRAGRRFSGPGHIRSASDS